MTRVADSSYIITLFDPDDPRRSDALCAAKDPEPILVPPEVITETLGILHGRIGFTEARGLWTDLGNLANVTYLDSTRGEEVAPIFLDAHGRLSWTDAAVVAHCQREDAEPLCYDEDIVATLQARRAKAT